MKNLFILGIALAVVLSAGTAMAAGDQNSETFQTLGSMQTIEMTDTELNAVEGKSFNGGKGKYRGYGSRGYKGGYTQYYKSNTNSTYQYNECYECSAYGGYGGGGNISQGNYNYTYQSN